MPTLLSAPIATLLKATILHFITFGISAGGLQWHATTVQIDVPATAKRASATFLVRNNQLHPIRLLDTKTSCGCTLALPAKRILAPGEITTIEVATGLADVASSYRSVVVTTDDPKNPQAVLALTVHKKQLVEMTPSRVSWTRGEKPSGPKIVKIINNQAFPLQLKECRSTNAKISGTLATVREGFEYTLTVKINNTDEYDAGTLTLVAVDPADAKKEKYHQVDAIVE